VGTGLNITCVDGNVLLLRRISGPKRDEERKVIFQETSAHIIE
jgi:hypothetical protein